MGTRWFKMLAVVVVVSVMLTGSLGVVGAAGPTAEKPTIVIAMDSDIDHIEPMEFRSDAGYYATANLYEPLLRQKLVADPTVWCFGGSWSTSRTWPSLSPFRPMASW